MSQKEDIVFCKIAISNGLVSESDAQKVLALCDKREREAGQRPPIGEVFAKYNLLKAADVLKLNEAVRKRTGVSVASARPAARGARKRGPARGPARGPVNRRRGEAAGAEKPIDPKTLWMGIGGIVVFVALFGAMLYIVLKPEKKPVPVATSTPESSLPASAPAPKETPKAPAPKPAPSTDLSKDELLEVKQTIADARGMRGDDPEGGVKLLEAKKKALESKGRVAPKDLEEAIKELQSAKQAPAPGAGETPAEPAPAAAPKPAAETPPAAKPEEPAADSEVDKLLEDSK